MFAIPFVPEDSCFIAQGLPPDIASPHTEVFVKLAEPSERNYIFVADQREAPHFIANIFNQDRPGSSIISRYDRFYVPTSNPLDRPAFIKISKDIAAHQQRERRISRDLSSMSSELSIYILLLTVALLLVTATYQHCQIQEIKRFVDTTGKELHFHWKGLETLDRDITMLEQSVHRIVNMCPN